MNINNPFSKKTEPKLPENVSKHQKKYRVIKYNSDHKHTTQTTLGEFENFLEAHDQFYTSDMILATGVDPIAHEHFIRYHTPSAPHTVYEIIQIDE